MADTVFRFVFDGGGGGGSGAGAGIPGGGGVGGPVPGGPAGGGGGSASGASAAAGGAGGGSAWGTVAKVAALGANMAQGNLIGSLAGIASLAGGGPITAIVSAFTAVVGTVKAFDAAMQQNIQTLAAYSPAITAAQAQNEVAEEMQKMRRAEKYGDQLSNYERSSGRLSRAWTDFKEDLMMPFEEIGAGFKDFAAGVLESLHGTADGETKGVGQSLVDAMPFFSELARLREMERDQRATLSLAQDAKTKDRGSSVTDWFHKLPTIEQRVLDRVKMGVVGDRVAEKQAPKMELPGT